MLGPQVLSTVARRKAFRHDVFAMVAMMMPQKELQAALRLGASWVSEGATDIANLEDAASPEY